MLDTLGRIVKDPRVLALAETIVRAGGDPETPGVGLPIGNLTSQWLANLVLDRLDHYVKEILRVPGYVRYMDDFVLFDCAKVRLWRWKADVLAFLADPLGLSLKESATTLSPTSEGLPFLGWRIYPGTIRLRPENKRRVLKRLRQRRHEFVAGRRSESSYAACVRSVCAHLAHGSTLGLRRAWFVAVEDAQDPIRHAREPPRAG